MVLVGFRPYNAKPTGFLKCFDTVGLVIWPVKIVPNMIYNEFGGTLNLAQSIDLFLVSFPFKKSLLVSHRNATRHRYQWITEVTSLASAPLCISSCAEWAWSPWAAMCRGPRPLRVRTDTDAPRDTNSSMTSLWPLRHAQCSAVKPSCTVAQKLHLLVISSAMGKIPVHFISI